MQRPPLSSRSQVSSRTQLFSQRQLSSRPWQGQPFSVKALAKQEEAVISKEVVAEPESEQAAAAIALPE